MSTLNWKEVPVQPVERGIDNSVLATAFTNRAARLGLDSTRRFTLDKSDIPWLNGIKDSSPSLYAPEVDILIAAIKISSKIEVWVS